MKLQKSKDNRREFTNLSKIAASVREIEDRILNLEPVIGNWVPEVMFGTSNAGITYATQLGFYHKTGRLVHAWGRIVLSSKGAVSGSAFITKLPFPVYYNSQYQPMGSAKLVTITFANAYMIEGVPGKNQVALSEVTEAGTRTVLSYSDFSNTSAISFSLSYLTE